MLTLGEDDRFPVVSRNIERLGLDIEALSESKRLGCMSRSMNDRIFGLWNLIESFFEYQRYFWGVYVDFKKAFD